MLQRLGVRGKILAVVAVPILVLVLAAGFVTWGAATDLSNARNSEDLIETLGAVQTLGSDLQVERRTAVNYVHTFQHHTNELSENRVVTDSQLANVLSLLEASDDPAAAQVESDLLDVFGGASGSDVLASQRASLLPAAEAGEWLEFPSADEVEAMAAAYTDAQEATSAIANDAPGSLNVSTPIAALAFRVGAERDSAVARLTEPVEWRDELEAVYGRVDATLDALAGRAEELAGTEQNLAAVASLLQGREVAANLVTVRGGTMATAINIPTLTGYYSGLLGLIVSASSDVTVALNDANLIAHVQAVGALDALIENVSSEGVYIERLIRTGAFAPGGVEVEVVRDLTLRSDIALETAQDVTTTLPDVADAPPFGASQVVQAGATSSFSSTRSSIANGLDASLVAAQNTDWAAHVAAEVAPYTAIRAEAYSEVQSLASAAAQGALLTTLLTAAAAAIIIVLSLVVALLIARRIVGPLRRLTTTATAVRQELPRLVERVAIPGEVVDASEVQVPVESQDEIGRLADAFNGVNAATLSIAGEQAALRGSISEMFVNVARRDQVLLNRQLASIDEMERTEDDPTTLTKLFALDHLATRMRRNSESLLVLAGIDTGRRLRSAMPLSDVIRTASSEIELYERVQLELDADPAMLGHSALTAAHLFAELLENATVFSDPGSPVVVRTSHDGDDVVVEIIDSGIGMTEAELVEANNRVGSTAASEILGEQRLGLFVVGRIGRRVGAAVQLQSTEGQGTVATVTMPAGLFEDEGSTVSEAPAPAAAPSVPAASASAASMLPVAPESRPAYDLPAYAPAAVEEGAILSGRAPAEEPSIDALISADAQAAPEGTPTDPSSLTEGESSAGLPTRRRRGEGIEAEDPEREARSVVGLPARATDAQLSALAAESQGGFTPAVPASEITPQSAEERASMFRGFRARRMVEEAARGITSDVTMDESLGHAVRRGAVARDELEVPRLEGDDGATVPPSAAVGAAAFFGARRAAAAERADQQAESTNEPAEPAAEATSALAAEAPVGEPSGAPEASAEEPVITHGLGEPGEVRGAFHLPKATFPAGGDEIAPAETTAHGPTEPFVVPTLEQDEDEPAVEEAPDPAEPESLSPAAEPALEQWGGVEQVALDEGQPQVSAPYPHWPAESESQAAPVPADSVPAQAVLSEPPLPEPELSEPAPVAEPVVEQPAIGQWEAESAAPQAPVEPAAEGPAAPAPRLDDLIQSAVDEEQENRPGFFAKLFGRGQKSTAPAVESPASAGPTNAGFAPITPRTNEPAHRPMPDQLDQLSSPLRRPMSQVPPAVAPAPVEAAPVGPPSTAPSVSSAPGTFLPAGEPQQTAEVADWAPSAPSQPGVFTPDQLAQPAGWEAAGASALQAAQPEVGMSYQPVIQPEGTSDHGSSEFTSAVFSELSSLAAERPKVEKTRAGLQRRRAQDAQPVEVTPIAAEVEIAPIQRDADAVRNRFSAFYSGTERARSDAAAHSHASDPAEVTD